MAISEAFRNYAEHDPVYLESELTKKMEELGYIFHAFTQINDSPWMPRPTWDELVENLGGEAAIDADYDGGDKFTVKHIKTGITSTSNSSIEALSRLWVAINS